MRLNGIWAIMPIVILLLVLQGCQNPIASGTDGGGSPAPLNFTGRWQINSLSSFAIQTAFNLTIDFDKDLNKSCTNYRCYLTGYAELSSAQSQPPNPPLSGTYFFRDGFTPTTGFAIISMKFLGPSIGDRKYVVYVDVGTNTDQLYGYYQEWDPGSGNMLRSSQIKMMRLR